MRKWVALGMTTVLLAASLVIPSATPKASAQSSVTYTVQPGDSLWKIAVKYKVGVQELINANKLQNPNLIYPGQKITVPQLPRDVVQFQNEVVRLTNVERSKAGLRPLAINWELQRVARIKSEDMRDKNYFEHNSPTYGTPFNMMKTFGITYTTAGENIAAGQPTPAEVVRSWMNSPGHRANILKAEYTQIGCGVAFGGSYRVYWTQQFIRR